MSSSEKKKKKRKIIDQFRGLYRFLSNFFRFQATLTTEHLYQSFKTTNPRMIKRILEAKTPREARRLGRLVKQRKEWSPKFSKDVMRHFVYAKFIFNKNLKQALIETHPRVLIERNVWGDRFWGKVGKEGKNEFGKILMELRELFIEELEDD